MNRLAPQLAFVIFVAATGCKHTEPNYCEDVPVTHNCMDKIDADSSCSGNAQCSGATPVCDVGGSKTCVQCTTADATACSGATPVCGTSKTCERCTMHAQCSSNVCLPDGSCSDGANVAYVAVNGAGSACTKAMPCGTLAAAISTSKSVVKMAAGIVKDTTTTTIDGKAVTILADPGAKLDRDGDGPILEVRSASADVKIYDLEITGASGVAGADGVDLVPNGGMPKLALTHVKVASNQGAGIAATGGQLTVSQSTISGNLGGGVSITNADFNIVNNFITRNGDPNNGTIGGASLTFTGTGVNRFEFNTVVDNNIKNTALQAAGVTCDTAGFSSPNNIISRNLVGSDATKPNANTLGVCTYPTAAIAPTVTALKFASADSTPYDYHLTAGSSAIDQATTASTVNVDIDGDLRPQGAKPDIGADEAP